MKSSTRIVENHIYCDGCNLDSADTEAIGYSQGISMHTLKLKLVLAGWHVSKAKDGCDLCPACRAKRREHNERLR